MNDNTVMVSICCLTYNHAPYIRECLDGFLMQQVDFSIEIIIHDDASTDGTQDILREYQEKYPDLFHLILQTENQYSKGIHVTIEYIFPKVKGKYIAFCEGDDYWTDSYKLQKQVNFLEAHPDYSLCCHATKQYIQQTGELSKWKLPRQVEGRNISFTCRDWTHYGWFFWPLSVVLRKSCLDVYFLSSFPLCRDVHTFYSLLQHGKGYFMDECMSVYRRHDNGVWSGISYEQKRITSLANAYDIYQEDKNADTRRMVITNLGELLIFYLRYGRNLRKAWKVVPLAIRYCGCRGILGLCGYICRKTVDKCFR